jgi:hypothetical protein
MEGENCPQSNSQIVYIFPNNSRTAFPKTYFKHKKFIKEKVSNADYDRVLDQSRTITEKAYIDKKRSDKTGTPLLYKVLMISSLIILFLFLILS